MYPGPKYTALGLTAVGLAVLGALFILFPAVRMLGVTLLITAIIIGVVVLTQRDRIIWEGVTAICLPAVILVVAAGIGIASTPSTPSTTANQAIEASSSAGEASTPSATFSAQETQAAQTAYSEAPSATNLVALYSACEEPWLGHQTRDPAVWSDDWTRHRVQGALILCPDHKDRAAVEEQLKATEGKPSQSEVEKKAVQVAYGTQPSTGTKGSDEYERDLEILKELCDKRYLGDTEGNWPWSESQRQEAKGAFVLCPDHQDRSEVEARWSKGEQADQGRAEGTRFGNGTFRVGQKIQPGTYQTETTASEGFSACYWERQDEAGNIIDNNFMSGALQAQVVIAPTDFAFMSRGCGEWHQ